MYERCKIILYCLLSDTFRLGKSTKERAIKIAIKRLLKMDEEQFIGLFK